MPSLRYLLCCIAFLAALSHSPMPPMGGTDNGFGTNLTSTDVR